MTTNGDVIYQGLITRKMNDISELLRGGDDNHAENKTLLDYSNKLSRQSILY